MHNYPIMRSMSKENLGNRFKFNQSQKSSTSALCATTQEGNCAICYKNHGLKACVSDASNLVIELKCGRNLHASISKVGITVSCIKIQHALTWKKSRWSRPLNYHPRRQVLLCRLQSRQILLQCALVGR